MVERPPSGLLSLVLLPEPCLSRVGSHTCATKVWALPLCCSPCPGKMPVYLGERSWDPWDVVMTPPAGAAPSLGWRSLWDFPVWSSVKFIQGELDCKFPNSTATRPWTQPRSVDAAEQTTDLSLSPEPAQLSAGRSGSAPWPWHVYP